MKFKKSILFVLYTIVIGAITGLLIWAFLWLMNMGINLLWHVLPEKLSIPFYTIIVCTIGGFLIGLFKKKFGDYPEELSEVMGQVKKTGRYSYKDIFPMLGCALFPLVLGASVGPEAGLTGVIAGLCTWVGDKLKGLFKDMKELTDIGVSATLGTIFRSPMFGFVEPIEEDKETVLPRSSKIVLYFTAILSSFGIFILMNKLTGSGGGMESFEAASVKLHEWLYAIPLSLAGILGGYLYFIFAKLTKIAVKPLEKAMIIKCTLGGLLLGISGFLLPLTMFSGEHQMSEVTATGAAIGAVMLIVIGIVKLLITNICIESGLKGGHFFPLIFSGICIGFAASLITGLDSVFCMSVVTTAVVGHTMKKPLATVLLLMIVFPPQLIPVMLASAVLACFIKTPACFMPDSK